MKFIPELYVNFPGFFMLKMLGAVSTSSSRLASGKGTSPHSFRSLLWIFGPLGISPPLPTPVSIYTYGRSTYWRLTVSSHSLQEGGVCGLQI